MLFDPAAHEPLTGAAWDAGRASAGIEAIVADAHAHHTPGRWWPVHPRDVEPGDPDLPPIPFHFGAAGVVWALDRLGAPLDADLDALIADDRAWLEAAGYGGEDAAYLMGETPIALLAHDRAPTPERADRLALLIDGNRGNPARELMWGAPGTMLAALLLHERTGEERWAALFRASAATLREQLVRSDEHGCCVWIQDLYGRQVSYLDGVHGFVATASVLIRGRALLGDAWPAWERIVVETVSGTATREGAWVNWRPLLDMPPGREGKLVVQFCHGAPGFVSCLAGLPTDALDDLLLAAGETTWAAGPLVKGPSLCHGTAGNGYAFLALLARTGDERWLERARAFAMHALEQVEAERARQGHGRHSLWTGDLGVALFLAACRDARPGFPSLDWF